MTMPRAETDKPIFISYSRVEATFASQLFTDLEALGFVLWRDREKMPIGDQWWAAIKDAIDRCDTMVLCMSPDALHSPTVTDEWQYAREIGKRVMPVVAADIAFDQVPRWMAARDWADFRPGAKEAAVVWARFINQLNQPYEVRKVPFMVDPLPTNFTPRPMATEPLIAALTDPNRRAGAQIVGLRGAGGYGKTTLARAIVHDRRVRGVFDDGVLWVTLGEKVTEQDLVDRLLDLTVKLIGSRPPVTTLIAAGDELRKAIGDRHILLVIDDVWQSAHLQPFLLGTKHTAFLITTRNNAILPAEALRQVVDAMQPTEAIALLGTPFATIDRPPADAEAAKLRVLADRLGRWPLLLILANKILVNQLGYRASLAEALDFVGEALTYGGFDELNDPHNPDQRHSAISATLAVSLRLLDPIQAARFQQLAIFQEDSEIPLVVLEKLWGVSRFEVQKNCQRYADLSLLLAYDAHRRVIQLHDVVRVYLRDTHKSDLAAWHDQLLTGYALPERAPSEPDWTALPADDPYLWRALTYHLREADHEATVRTLLADPQWLAAKLKATDINALLADFEDLTSEDETRHLIHSALILSAHVLAADRSQLGSQLSGRLFTHRADPAIAVLLSRFDLVFQPVTATHTQAGGSLIRILTGHTEKIGGAIAVRDGRLISWAGRTVQIREADGTPGRTLATYKARVRIVLELGDGRLLTWADDGYIRLWQANGDPIDASAERVYHVYGALVRPTAQAEQIIFWSDQAITFWSPENGIQRTIEAIDGHATTTDHTPYRLHGVLALRDGRLLSWGTDQLIRLWRADGTLIKVLSKSQMPIGGVLERQNGQLLSWTTDGAVQRRDRDGESIGTIDTLAELMPDLHSILELRNGHLIAWAEHDRRLFLWEADGKPIRTLVGHTGDVRGALELDDGRIASWSSDGTLRLWMADGLRIRTLPGHVGEVGGALFLTDGRLLSWSADHTLRLWDSHAGDDLGRPADLVTQPIKGMYALNNSQLLWWVGTTLRLWEADGSLHRRLTGHSKDVRGARNLTDGRLISWAGDGTLRLWASDGTLLRTLPAPAEDVTGARQLADGRLVAWLGDGTIQLWTGDGEPLQILRGHTGYIMGVWMLDDGRLLSYSGDGTLHFWTADGRPIRTVQGHQGSVSGLIRLRNGRLLSWGTDNLLRLWDTEGAPLRTLDGHTGYIWGAFELTDGRLLSWADSVQLRLWAADGSLICTLDGHSGKVRGATQLPDGRLLSWADDGTLRLWDQTGAPLRSLPAHEEAIKGVIKLDDGRWLSWAKDSTLRLWRADGEPIAVLTTDSPLMRCLTLVSSAQPILAANDEQGRVLLLRIAD